MRRALARQAHEHDLTAPREEGAHCVVRRASVHARAGVRGAGALRSPDGAERLKVASDKQWWRAADAGKREGRDGANRGRSDTRWRSIKENYGDRCR